MSGRRYNRPNSVYQGSQHPGAGVTFGDKTIATLYNPFSIKNTTPKWPDGLANFSLGLKMQYASEIYGKELTLVLFPGCTNWCLGYTSNEVDDNPNAPINTVIVNLNHGDDRGIKIVQKRGVDTDNVTFAPVVQTYSSWRGVSYAMKIKCCNTDEQNDGWFEAVRIPKNMFLERTGLALFMNATPPNQPGELPANRVSLAPTTNRDIYNPVFYTGQILPSWAMQSRYLTKLPQGAIKPIPSRLATWKELPTFATGKLKDIGDVMFQLNPAKEHNEFIKLKAVNGRIGNSADTDAVTVPNYAGDPKLGNLNYAAANDGNYFVLSLVPNRYVNDPDSDPAGATQHYNLMQDQVDHSFVSDSFDVILVQIHGITATRLLVHSVANVELLCHEFSANNQYQTVAYAAKDKLARYIDFRQTNCQLPFHYADQYTN